ncbi:MAG: hypothetical protein ACRC5Q_07730, partial [Culicoidibacterales bacterium]
MIMLASDAISSLLLIVCFFSVWLMSTFPRALALTCGVTVLLFLSPLKVISIFSVIIAAVIIIILTIVTEFTVN